MRKIKATFLAFARTGFSREDVNALFLKIMNDIIEWRDSHERIHAREDRRVAYLEKEIKKLRKEVKKLKDSS